ncbi:CLUMA_CG020673, isoform A [Clunio marinus]|uniref:CLUMA_CG020673, isoform A n=1 Tax=Clunio marinus TaxID=568069 RepID=A0A1J1J5P7_9DIPT|nr:CLUMA_CG020673, isoform A [Clunio marinus]
MESSLIFFVSLFSSENAINYRDKTIDPNDLIRHYYDILWFFEQFDSEFEFPPYYLNHFENISIKFKLFLMKSIESDILAVLKGLIFLHEWMEKSDDESQSKAVCSLLLAYHIDPLLTQVSDKKRRNKRSINKFFTIEMFNTRLDFVMDHALKGLKYNSSIAVIIGQNYCNAVQNNREFYVHDYLNNYKHFFVHNNPRLVEIAIESLEKIIKNAEEYSENVKDFLLNEENIPPFFDFLIMHKIDEYIFLLMTAIIFFKDRECMYGNDKRFVFYEKNMRIGNSKLINLTYQMMVKFEDNPFHQLVTTFSNLGLSLSEMNNIITYINITPQNLFINIFKMASENLNDKIILHYAHLLLNQTSHLNELSNSDKTNVKKSLSKIFAAELNSITEENFNTILMFMTQAHRFRVIEDLPECQNFINFLTKAFNHYQLEPTLHKIMKIFSIMNDRSPVATSKCLESLILYFYDELLRSEASIILGYNVDMKSLELPLLKISVLLELSNTCTFGFIEIDSLLIVTTNHLTNYYDSLFLSFARLRTILLRKLWDIILELEDQNSLPYDLTSFATSAYELSEGLMKFMNRYDLSKTQACNAFKSMTGLICYFNLPFKTFKTQTSVISQLEITEQQFKKIIRFVEFYAFFTNKSCKRVKWESDKELDNPDKFFHQNEILFALSKLLKRTKQFSGLFMLLQHFNYDFPFISELDLILQNLYENKDSFIATIALTVYDFAKHSIDIEEFKKFCSYLSDFIIFRLKIEKEEKSKFLLINTKICDYVLKNVLSPYDVTNNQGSQLDILSYLEIYAIVIDNKKLTF